MNKWRDTLIKRVLKRYIIGGGNPVDIDVDTVIIGLGIPLKEKMILKKRQKFGQLFIGMINGVKVGFIKCPPGTALLESIILVLTKMTNVKNIIGIGTTGSISPERTIGDFIIPSYAVAEEALSGTYRKLAEAEILPEPDNNISKILSDNATHLNSSTYNDKILTVASLYSETKENIEKWQAENIKALDMECSALFTMGKFFDIKTTAILVVSDNILSGSYYAFNKETSKHFSKGLEYAITAIGLTIKQMKEGIPPS